MKKIGRFFTNPIVISIFGLLLISLLIWFAGPHIKFGESNTAPLGSVIARLVAIMVIIVLWGLNNLRIQMQNSRSNQSLVKDRQLNENLSQANVVFVQASEEIHQIIQRFAQAQATLK